MKYSDKPKNYKRWTSTSQDIEALSCPSYSVEFCDLKFEYQAGTGRKQTRIVRLKMSKKETITLVKELLDFLNYK